MKIAIIDSYNRDIGIKILFPEADYYVMKEEYNRKLSYEKYNFEPQYNIENIDTTYDTLLLIICEYNCFKTYNNKSNEFYIKESEEYMRKIVEIINNNDFKKICIFDNNDYDYDPTIIYDYYNDIKNKDILFFKRNYVKTKTYHKNVYPYPYTIFGKDLCMTELITSTFYENLQTKQEKENRIFFSGTLFYHVDHLYGVIRDRITIMSKIQSELGHVVYHCSNMGFNEYIKEMSKSKLCLDLLGVGDPNRRTFEIFASGSLRIAERNNLQWTFDDDFCEETYFSNVDELKTNVTKLLGDDALYNKCLEKQNEIVKKHMNKNALKKYIIDKIQKE